MEGYPASDQNTNGAALGPKPFRRLRCLGLLQLLARRDFRLLWLGESISTFGDQFSLVALPWLMLQLTGSGLALGTVLIAVAVPRAVLLLLGGALSDRLSPRRLLLAANLVQAAVTAAFMVLLLLRVHQLWHIYVLAVGYGVAAAFFYPAFNALVPTLVDKDHLPSANALLQGTTRLATLIGPAPAGIVIAALGVPVAFGLDALSFLFAALTLGLMHEPSDPSVAPAGLGARQADGMRRSPWGDVLEGLHYAWSDTLIRPLLLVIALLNLIMVGALSVGMPALANHRFAAGAAALGMMLSASGGGALLGTFLVGVLRRPRRPGLLVSLVICADGLGLASLAWLPSPGLASLVIGAMSLGTAFIYVVGTSWIQSKTQPGLLGRVMSLLTFASMGLAPVSLALAGALVDMHLNLFFIGGGALLVIVALILRLNRTVCSAT